MISIEEAKAARRAARAKLTETFAEIQERIEPSRFMSDAASEVRERSMVVVRKATERAKERPVVVTAGVLAGLALIARKPLWQHARQLFGSVRETSTADSGSTHDTLQKSSEAKG